MTVKAIALLKRKPGISRQAFVQHYETSHVPLMMGLLTGVIDYRRNYVDGVDSVAGPAALPFGYDSVTELWFVDRAAFDDAMRIMVDPGRGPKVAEDEEHFIDRPATQMFLVEEHGPNHSVDRHEHLGTSGSRGERAWHAQPRVVAHHQRLPGQRWGTESHVDSQTARTLRRPGWLLRS